MTGFFSANEFITMSTRNKNTNKNWFHLKIESITLQQASPREKLQLSISHLF